MTREERLSEGFKSLIKVPLQVLPATVLSVDEENYTIDVEPIGFPEFPEVRLKAAIDGVKDGVVEIPEVESTVLIGIILNQYEDAFLLKCSKVSKIVINGGSNGGLINIKTLIEELDKTKAVVDAIKQSLDSWVVVASDGGAALKTLWGTNGSGKSTGNFSSMEDDKVTH
jgi:hypothetical protein